MRVRWLIIGAVLALALGGVLSWRAEHHRGALADAPTGLGDTLTVRGRGYGHGHGLSQYGAQGAARQGLGYRAILSFYYPRTRLGRYRDRLRVLLTEQTGRALVVRAARGLTIRARGVSRRPLPRNGADRWRVRTTGDRSSIEFRRGGWRTWRLVTGPVDFGSRSGPIRLRGGVSYRGVLRSQQARPGSPRRLAVNVVPVEDYLRGVVPMEIPALWEPAAVRAQAVAARTYAAREAQDHAGAAYDLCDTTACQVYGGAGAEHSAADAAIRATRSRILRYHGEPAFTQFSASNGGWTAAGGERYLPAKPDPYDSWPGNPYSSWTQRLSTAAIERAWPAIGTLTELRIGERDGHGRWGGRIRTIDLVGSAATVSVGGEDFRAVLGLRSTWFTIG